MAHESRGCVDNIRAVWKSTEAWEREEGLAYYPRQLARIAGEAEQYKVPTFRAVGAFAALSPNNLESTTYRALRVVLGIHTGEHPRSAKVSAYGINKRKALAILAGGDPSLILRGPKVRAFYFSTLDPSQEEIAVVDGHMLGVWMGRPLPRLNSREANIPPAEYEEISAAYKLVAKEESVALAGMQAAVWLRWKRVHGIAWKAQMGFEWHY